MTTIRLEGYDDLLRRVTTLAQLKHLQAAVKAAGEHVKRAIDVYPHHTPRPQPFVSDKQRRGFFAKLRAGEIEVPYRRTDSLKHGWNVTTRNAGLTAVVGNSVAYGPLVQSAEKQTGYHATTGWITDREVVSNEREAVLDFIAQELQKAVNG